LPELQLQLHPGLHLRHVLHLRHARLPLPRTGRARKILNT
jgi:hypothetical protein